MSLDPDQVRQRMDALIAAEGRDEMQAAAEQVLNLLLKQHEALCELANGYPRNPISGDVWFKGRALAVLCDELAGIFARKKCPREEELASRLATGMALQVLGHYPEEIFPRVLRNAHCREALSDRQGAIDGYEAIVADFDEMGLADLLQDEAPLEVQGRAILEAVHEAAARLGGLRPEQAASLQDLQHNVQSRLARE